MEQKKAMERELARRRQRGEEINSELLIELQQRVDSGDLFEEGGEEEEEDDRPQDISASRKKDSKKKKSRKPKDLQAQRAAEQKKLDRPNFSSLAFIGLANNQLGTMAGYGLATMVRNCKALTALDVSRNSIGYIGGVAFADGL